ncbi:Uncharacterised protein [Mycobacteroides abscessus subsp. abscessus]|nr:Uncharacterised protein [Mycobacteroides abscessus subsp. abscessus]
MDAYAADHGFRIDKSSGTVTALNENHDPSDMEYIVSTAKQVLAAGESSDAQLTRAVDLLDGPDGDLRSSHAGGTGSPKRKSKTSTTAITSSETIPACRSRTAHVSTSATLAN